MNKRYFVYAMAITIVTTIVCWVSMFDSTSSSGYRSRGYGGSYSGGGHK
ncbi:hypothetical protein [Massilia sp. KIM]|nr:hypothetical protein [Massilia sp. KIM]